MNERYTVIGESIHFHKTGCVFHISFIKRYKSCRSIIEIRERAKDFHSKSQQNEIIHYIKQTQS